MFLISTFYLFFEQHAATQKVSSTNGFHKFCLFYMVDDEFFLNKGIRLALKILPSLIKTVSS